MNMNKEKDLNGLDTRKLLTLPIMANMLYKIRSLGE